MSDSFLIPQRNCLVLMIGPSGSGKSTLAAELFYPHEIISSDAIRMELTDDFRRQDKNDVVFVEINRRITTRLSLGLRTVFDATNLKFKDRAPLVALANSYNFEVIYLVVNRSLEEKVATAGWRTGVFGDEKSLVARHEDVFISNERAILNGDGDKSIKVIDTRYKRVGVVNMKQFHPDYSKLLTSYDNIRIIADVHGNFDGLKQALNAPKNTFFIFLGDVVDYGDNIISVFDAVFELVNNGDALCVRGNHEKKMATLISYYNEHGDFGKKRISHGNQATFDQLALLDDATANKWQSKFISFEDMCPDFIRFANVLLVHGACHPSMWSDDHFRVHARSKIESFAMYGETTGEFIDDYPVRIYDWVDNVPKDKLVIVGHDIRSTETPLVSNNSVGGSVIFLDTGSAKGGKLSWVDGKINGNSFTINAITSA